MSERISTLDSGYETGDLSLFPDALDDKASLYEVKNNAETILRAGLAYNGKYVIVEDASKFPDQGILRLGPPPGKPGESELIYYGTKANNVFKDLVRGFCGSRQNKWNSGTSATNSVCAEIHNAVKDALLKMQLKIGKLDHPDTDSLHWMVKQLEITHLAPKALFRAFPRKGFPALTVRFQSFSTGDVIRYLWDFGDGASSIEKNPSHTYQQEGIYSVTLSVITSSSAQGVVTKSNYITVSETERMPFFYFSLADPDAPAYSIETATANSAEPAVWNFVDQTDGDITQRFWVFDDGTTEVETNPSKHFTTHIYEKPGTYTPSLLVLFSSDNLKRIFLQEDIVVL